ncbi:hypothetical protein PRZ48_003477 [Zasmidium cellare]|uniref:Uncharacterized protein n=1 Tax=Zasmidium cellare TaxID=395010 RepID=A0ABR0EVT6_ZASCE|nr:hypothetical protein PRZ48_003477 [Zasmidium cellare]
MFRFLTPPDFFSPSSSHRTNRLTHSSFQDVADDFCAKHSCDSHLFAQGVENMAGPTNPSSDDSRFKTKFVDILIKHSINSAVKVDAARIKGWTISDEVVPALRKWKLNAIDIQTAYGWLKQLLDTDIKRSAAAAKTLASFAASKHVLESDDFAREAEAQGRMGVDNAWYTFVATLRDLVFETSLDSAVKLPNQGDDAVDKKIQSMYEFAAYLLLDVLLVLQGDKSYWASRLGGNVVNGWSTVEVGDEDKKGSEGDDSSNADDDEATEHQEPDSLMMKFFSENQVDTSAPAEPALDLETSAKRAVTPEHPLAKSTSNSLITFTPSTPNIAEPSTSSPLFVTPGATAFPSSTPLSGVDDCANTSVQPRHSNADYDIFKRLERKYEQGVKREAKLSKEARKWFSRYWKLKRQRLQDVRRCEEAEEKVGKLEARLRRMKARGKSAKHKAEAWPFLSRLTSIQHFRHEEGIRIRQLSFLCLARHDN